MKSVIVRVFIVFLSFFSIAWAEGPRPMPQARPADSAPRVEVAPAYPTRFEPGRRPTPHSAVRPGTPRAPQISPLRSPGQIARLPEAATGAAMHIACPSAASELGAACAYVNVPLDRTNLKKGLIPINVELYRHTAAGPAESAILVNWGGPGNSTTGNRSAAMWLFASDLDVHDILLIDDRGAAFPAPSTAQSSSRAPRPGNRR